jgi:hypothetical protein
MDLLFFQEPAARFLSRQEFKDQYNIALVDLKPVPSQIRVHSFGGDDPQGIVREVISKPGPSSSEDGGELAEQANYFMRTTTRLVWEKSVLAPEDHLFESQAGLMFEAKCKERAQPLGQRWAQRYSPKMKVAPVYKHQDLLKMVAALGPKSSRGSKVPSLSGSLLALTGGEQTDNDDDGTASVASVASTPLHAHRRPSALVRDPEDKRHSEPFEMASPLVEEPAVGDIDIVYNQVNQSASASGLDACASTAVGDFPGEDSDVEQEQDEKAARVKAPIYWHAKLHPANVFKGKSLTNTIKFAKACVSRIVSSDNLEALRAWRGAMTRDTCLSSLVALEMNDKQVSKLRVGIVGAPASPPDSNAITSSLR